eukprot:8953426-Karenia_brevis.AAC.1
MMAITSSRSLEPEILPSAVDNIAKLIEQRGVKDVKTEEHVPLPFKSTRPTVAALYVGPFVLDTMLRKKAD